MISEKQPWPNWLLNQLPSWLQTISYPNAGVGDLDDLRFKVSVGANGRWVGFINKGWYYFNNTEQYNYVQVASSLISVIPSTNTITNPISFRPSWGPVLISSQQTAPIYNFATYSGTGLTSFSSLVSPTLFNFDSALSTGLSLINDLTISTYSNILPRVITASPTYTPTTSPNVLNIDYTSGVVLSSVSGKRFAAAGFNNVSLGYPLTLKAFHSTKLIGQITIPSGQFGGITLNDYADTLLITTNTSVTGQAIDNFYYKEVSYNENQPYIQHANSLQPSVTLPWYNISGTSCYYTVIPSGAIFVGARDLFGTPFASVASSGFLLNDLFYWTDVNTGLVIIKPSDPTNIDVNIDLLYISPILLMRELVVQTDGQLIASYSGANGISDITFIRGYTTVGTSGTVNTNTFTNPIPNCFDGDWVVLQYYINKSFVVMDDQTINLYTTPSQGDTVIVNYESSVPDLLPEAYLNGATTSLNLNPIFPDSYRAGYLFHAVPNNPISSYWSPTRIDLNLDKKIILSDLGEMVKVRGIVYGDNSLPLPNYPINISYTSSASAYFQAPLNGLTDGRGEIHLLIKPASGVGVFNFTLTASTLTKSVSAIITTLPNVLNPLNVNNGATHLIITANKNADGSFQSYANTTTMDGIPIASNGSIQVISQLDSIFSLPSNSGNSILYNSQVTVGAGVSTTNPTAMSAFGYIPQPNDFVVAINTISQSTIVSGD